jgi:streptogrisin C
MTYRNSILTAIVVAGLALGAGPAGAADPSGAAKGGRAEANDAEIMAAMQRDLGLSADQVEKQRALQAKAIKLDQELQATLGSAFAGSAYDAKTGKLVVSVSDATRLDEVRAAGAVARLVKFSRAQLEAKKADLDVSAGKAKGAGAQARRSGGARQASVAGMTSWYVDTTDNSVHVTVQKGKAKTAKAALAKYGDAVTVVESDLAPTPTARYMDGGDNINNNCSAGINLYSGSLAKGFLLTAGHCVSPSSYVYGQGGTYFGQTLESWYTSGYDDALIRNDNAGFWWQGPWVDVNPADGGVITTRSYTDAPVGTTVCKSGMTTKWTCGSITAKNVTITYTSGVTVYGLTRHNACVEKGDSGGANVSWTGSYAAEGVTSGASLRWDGYRDRCLSAFGQANVSYYQPIADSLAYYGPRYGVGTW